MAALSQKLAPLGSTGNNTHAAVDLNADADTDGIEIVALQFNVTVAGATPTVSFKFQGSLDGTNWFDVLYITDATDTASAAVRTVIAVGASIAWVSLQNSRKFTSYRAVVSANTNVTYNADIVVFDTSST